MTAPQLDAHTPVRIEPTPDSNVTDLLEDRVAQDPDGAMFSRKSSGEWRPVSARSFAQQARHLAARLVEDGVQPGERIAILSATRYEWALVEFAAYYAGAVIVPVYDSSAPEQIARIIADSGATRLFTETETHRERARRAADILAAQGAHTPTTHRLDTLDPGALEHAALEPALAAEVERRRTLATLDSLATIVYSSGTTGEAKGARITHGNFVRLVVNIADSYSGVIRPDSRTLLFLPLAHVLARGVQLVAIHAGMTVGHLSDPAELLGELEPVRPTFLVVVPRLLEKVEAAVAQKAAGSGLGRVFAAARRTAIEVAQHRAEHPGGALPLGLRLRHGIYDRLFYARIRALFGGQVETLLSGASALHPDTARFFTGAGLPVVEGYGLTETTAPVTGNLPGQVRFGTVGRPVPGASVRISASGEILVRGIGVFERYERDELNSDAFDDGYFRTGDLGSLDADGYLTVTGRAKDLIVTSYGKNVAPEPLEQAIARHSPLVAQAVVVGESRPYLGALISLDPQALAAWAREKRVELRDRDIADIPELSAELRRTLDAVNGSVSNPEQVKRFRVIAGELTEANGYLTPTMKLKRARFVSDFADQITGLYAAP